MSAWQAAIGLMHARGDDRCGRARPTWPTTDHGDAFCPSRTLLLSRLIVFGRGPVSSRAVARRDWLLALAPGRLDPCLCVLRWSFFGAGAAETVPGGPGGGQVAARVSGMGGNSLPPMSCFPRLARDPDPAPVGRFVTLTIGQWYRILARPIRCFPLLVLSGLIVPRPLRPFELLAAGRCEPL